MPASPLASRIRRFTLALSLLHATFAVFHAVALDLAAISCRTFVAQPYQLALLALYVALPLLLPLWLISLITLGIERRYRVLVLGVLGVGAVVFVVQHVFAASLFYCDGDALAAALDWQAH